MYKQSVLLVYTTYSSVAKCTGCMSICMFEITSCQLHFQNETAATYFWVTTHLPPTMHQVTRFKSPGPHDVQESARCDQDKICTGTCVWITIKFENEATVSDLLLVHDTPPPLPRRYKHQVWWSNTSQCERHDPDKIWACITIWFQTEATVTSKHNFPQNESTDQVRRSYASQRERYDLDTKMRKDGWMNE